MFTSERHQFIIQELQSNGKIKVKELSERFEVSEDCIRKDLKHLEFQGKCERVYGGAILRPTQMEHNVFQRENVNVQSKKEVAQKAYDLIQNGETIFLDVSTINIILSQLLANGDKQCIVVSNMITILQILAKNPRLTVIGTGGNVNLELNGFIGANTLSMVSKHYFDRCFIGTTGIDFKNLQITTFDLDDGLIKEMVLDNSKQKYVVMEKNKFEMLGSYKFTSTKKIDYIITNNNIDEKMKKTLKKSNLKYI